jgi:hypothetical protein
MIGQYVGVEVPAQVEAFGQDISIEYFLDKNHAFFY